MLGNALSRVVLSSVGTKWNDVVVEQHSASFAPSGNRKSFLWAMAGRHAKPRVLGDRMETTRKDLLSAVTEKPAVAVISDWPGHAPNGKYVLELSDSMVLHRVW